MAIFGRKIPKHHLVEIHKDNATSTDWIVLLEASTIVGPSPYRLRIARTTQERKIVKRRSRLFGKKYFLVVDGYDPRIHATIDLAIERETTQLARRYLSLFRNAGARQVAVMVAERGANAIIAMRFDASDLGSMWTEICAYGTAVHVTRI